VAWNFLSAEAFTDKIVKDRASGYISGIAGVGKSWTMKGLRKELEAQGVWVKVVAKCHVAALNAGGQTADSFLHKYQNGGFAQKTCCLILEEVCTLDTRILTQLAKRKRMPIQIICLGCPNQYKPIGSEFNGIPTDPEYEASAFLRSLCDGNRLHLTESWRSGDGPLWGLYSSLAIGGKRHDWPLERQIALAKKRFPYTGKDSQWNLVTSNAQRVALNTRLNRKFYAESGERGLWLPRSEKKAANEAQGYWLYKGMILIAYIPQGLKRGCHNGQLLQCLSLGDPVLLKDIESGVQMEQPLEFCRDYLRLAFAFTGYSAQGRSLGNEASEKEPERALTVWTDHPKFDGRALFTGISRCRSGNILQVA